MKKSILVLMFCFFLISIVIPSITVANGEPDGFTLVGREIWPGIEQDGIVKGAIIIGKVFNSSNPIGYFTVTFDHNGNGVEECKAKTEILRFKLSMSLTGLGRIVLGLDSLYPPFPTADWLYDAEDCLEGGPCWDSDFVMIDCDDEYTHELSLVAEVASYYNPIVLQKQRVGTYGSGFRHINYGTIYGLLIHTPPVFPAVIGHVSLHEELPVPINPILWTIF